MKILALSGLVPEHICDVVRFVGYPGRRNIAHYCGYAADFITQVIEDPAVDGAVFPRSCDSSRVLKSYLDGTKKYLFQLTVPALQDSFAENIFAEELKHFRQAVETQFGVECLDIERRAKLLAERNLAIKKAYDSLDSISYVDYHEAIMDILKQPLMQQCFPKFTEKKLAGKPVYLIGSTLTDAAIIKKICDCGMSIVGDDLPESGRLASARPVFAGGDIFLEIARDMLSRRLSPSQNNFASHVKQDVAEILDRGVRGVIFITQKYCEPYEYFYYVLMNKLREINIPTLKISLTDSFDFGRHELAIEAFSDTI